MLARAEGYFDSSVLFGLLRLNVFERLGNESKSLLELASELDAEPERLARFLRAGVALKFLVSNNGSHFRVSPACRAVLLPGSEGYLGDWIRFLDSLHGALFKLDEAVLSRRGRLDATRQLLEEGERAELFTRAMHDYAKVRGKELADFLDLTSCRSLLDLGCGPGTYAFSLGLRNPRLRLYLLDLPPVLEVAKEVGRSYAIENRVDYLPLDVEKEEIPGSYDVILVSNTLHMLGEETSRKLIRRLYQSVNPGGSLVIQAQFLENRGTGGRWPVILDLLMLCLTREGRNHTVDETRRWLEEAGFRDIEFCPMSLLNTNSYLRGFR